MQQEIFHFQSSEHLGWQDFVVSEENRAAFEYLAQWPDWIHSSAIIYGASGAGKTHMAALWAQAANAVYILRESFLYEPRDMFTENCNFVLDNCDEYREQAQLDWIFHFVNILNEKKRFLLILTKTHPLQMSTSLRDLQSRLLSYPLLTVQHPNDELLLQIAKKLTKDLGIFISEEALRVLLTLIPRDVSTLKKALKALDKLALQLKKNITVAMVRRYFARSDVDNEHADDIQF